MPFKDISLDEEKKIAKAFAKNFLITYFHFFKD